MSNAFVAPHFQSPENAREWLENLRWPEGPVCSHCGTVNHAYKTKKPGWYRCAEKECRKDFTVTTGTVMERSHIALNKWLMAFYLLNASKKGMSAHQLHRALNLDYKSAWFMCHRIREAMRAGSLGPLGGEGKIVEADETYYGPVEKSKVRTKTTSGRPFTRKGKAGPANKRPIVALVERGGNVRTFHVPVADQATVQEIVQTRILTAKAVCTPTKANSITAPIRFLPRTKPSSTLPTNTCVMRMARPSIPIQRKVTSRCSSAACAAFISTAKRNIFTVISPSLTIATITAWHSATVTSTAPSPLSVALLASG